MSGSLAISQANNHLPIPGRNHSFKSRTQIEISLTLRIPLTITDDHATMSSPSNKKFKKEPLSGNAKQKSQNAASRWTNDEKQVMLNRMLGLIQAPIDWEVVAARVGGRTPLQCSELWRKSMKAELARIYKGH